MHTTTLILPRRGRRARFRVHGLLGNAPLAARLSAEDPYRVDARPATGTVTVELRAGEDESTWAARFDALAALHPRRGTGGSRAAAELPVADRPSVERPAVRRPGGGRGRRGQPIGALPPPRLDAPHEVAIAALLAADADASTDPATGLSSAQAAARLARDGPNEIRDVTGRSAGEILLGQFTSVPMGLLGASAPR